MDDRDFVRLLKSFNANSEVWWDSSPTGYTAFKQQLLHRYPTVCDYINELLPEQFACSPFGVSGVTTNPRLVTAAIIDESSMWVPRIQVLSQTLSAAHVQDALYAELIARGASLLSPLWQQTRHCQGWLSAQVNINDIHCAERMVQQGLALTKIAPNVMIKVPGSQAGYDAIEQLVAQGCSINNTFCFTVSQFAACLRAIRQGQAAALDNGTDVSGARYVITFMIGRFGAESLLDTQASERGIELTPADKRWAEIAIYHAIHALLMRSNSPARLLISSIKVDRTPGELSRCWHLEKTGERETCYTLTPEIIEFLVQRESIGCPVQPSASRVPRAVLHNLMKIPYFRDARFEESIAVRDFARHPAFICAHSEAFLAHQRLSDFIQGASQSVPMSMPFTGAVSLPGQTANQAVFLRAPA
jgi:transaldolase